MSLNNDYVTQKLQEKQFQILDMEQDPDSSTLVLTVIHEIHPEVEVFISLISMDEDGNDTMEMKFDGPDDYTDMEAKQVLQEVMDTLVEIIENGLIDNPVEAPEVELPEEEE